MAMAFLATNSIACLIFFNKVIITGIRLFPPLRKSLSARIYSHLPLGVELIVIGGNPAVKAGMLDTSRATLPFPSCSS
jgi:hypothetical protein